METDRHYIGRAGLHCCLPNLSFAVDAYQSAVDSLAQTHELGRDRTRRLGRDAYLELNLRRDGNEYCEIVDCNCDDPGVHNDG